MDGDIYIYLSTAVVGYASLQHYRPSNWVWLSLEIKQNHWIIQKKFVFHTSLEQMFRHMATDLSTEPTTMQQRLMCALKSAKLLPDGYCYLSDKGNEFLFGIIWLPLTTINGLDVVGLPGHRTLFSGATLKPRFTHYQLILKWLLLPILLRQ